MRITATILASLAALVPMTADAGVPADERPVPVQRSPDLWATVNVCDTPKHPNEIGIRASMPGLGRRAVLYMRFRIQYLDETDGEWHDVSKADSRYRKLGVARHRVLESGWTFRFLPPPESSGHTLRGVVTFAWRRGGRVVKRLREYTEAGHRSTVGADPRNHSAALCRMR